MSISTVVTVTYLPSALDSNSRIPSLRQDLLVIHTHNARTRLWLAVRVKSPHSTYTLSRGSCKGGEGTRQSRIQPRTGARSRTRYEPTSWCLLLATCLGYIPPSWITDRQTDNRKGRKKKRKHMHAINTLARIDR